MPEIPDITVYVERLEEFLIGKSLEELRVVSPFVLRTAIPSIRELVGKAVREVRRLGKRIVLGLEGELFIVIHLMISGRLHWKKRGSSVPRRNGLAAFDFPTGTLTFTEASTKKRASLHIVHGEEDLLTFDRGGLEILEATFAAFHKQLQRENHTLKRALTDPHIFSGIGNAYSDEILHRARLSPVKQTKTLSAEEARNLFHATQNTLTEWIHRLRKETGAGFPENVTAFREEMAVHGRYRKPCPDCGAPVQRIVYAQNEVNYCPECQNNGNLLADRSLSRLLKKNWPKNLEELEMRSQRVVK